MADSFRSDWLQILFCMIKLEAGMRTKMNRIFRIVRFAGEMHSCSASASAAIMTIAVLITL